ncbi:hypothetical protein BZA05DRAFT_389157 [Tricharina praecox]|uniref:uncharacterized protein n=1 Tax=Tricharina praecox TaxID=43433 RepID=UPI00221ED581|nr:uncharacterized protein BZA05DRAFT_389157 [Tricharina praecox]KAI5855622.1 hypothetical protein BZA05DRAFT_389157 [Tricharina praecox]
MNIQTNPSKRNHPNDDSPLVMPFPSAPALSEAGFLPALPRNLEQIILTPHPPKPLLVSDLPPIPSTALARGVTDFAASNLPKPTFNHSMRVYHLGLAIREQHLPQATFSAEVYYMLSLLHDLGTTLADTAMSFEFSGAIKARETLLVLGADEVFADSVAEAIIRHQDVYDGAADGGQGETLTALTAVVQFATLLDNTGKFAGLVHSGTMDDVVAKWPREGWTGCFCRVIRDEGERKPWCHTTTIGIERFQELVKGNEVASKYEVEMAERVV